MEKGPYVLVQDDDCHWYVIPFSRQGSWSNWFGSDDYDNGVVPSWAKEVGGCPSLVSFNDYKIN